MWSDGKNFPARGYFTPPTKRSSRPPDFRMPASERKRTSSPSPSPGKSGLFHVIHKVPPGDSPYVKAKRVQLIDRDPSRAISLFWAAINSGDRVDSALKDMAIMMKQLNRSDEAIEAIKSFRHLCSFESQESLDNVLIELYKRAGRIEEEIQMLEQKLKYVEAGKGFSGSRRKTAKSQGKRIHVTKEQERSRILGNLAWAYLQLKNYEVAEKLYREASSLESDKNKQCNLSICLMHMNKLSEAKEVLNAVKFSSNDKDTDESYIKSLDRASQMLTEIESGSNKLEEGEYEVQKSFTSPWGQTPEKSTCSAEQVENCVARSVISNTNANQPGEQTWILNERNILLSKGAETSSGTCFGGIWRETSCIQALSRHGPRGDTNMTENQIRSDTADWSSQNKKINSSASSFSRINKPSSEESRRYAHRRIHASPAATREFKSNITANEEPKMGRDCLEKATHPNYHGSSESNPAGDTKSTLETSTQRKEDEQYSNFSMGKLSDAVTNKCWINIMPSDSDKRDEPIAGVSQRTKSFRVDGKHKKCWADMVEEEEQAHNSLAHRLDKLPEASLWFETPTQRYHNRGSEEFDDENLDINILCQNPTFVDLEDNSKSPTGTIKLRSLSSSRSTPTARRSLNFNLNLQQELAGNLDMLPGAKMADHEYLQEKYYDSCSGPAKAMELQRRKRLQVFQDITRLPHQTV